MIAYMTRVGNSPGSLTTLAISVQGENMKNRRRVGRQKAKVSIEVMKHVKKVKCGSSNGREILGHDN
jgi:hypothetical protein